MTQPITAEAATEQQQLTAAALIALAEGILHGLVPLPTSIDVWVQRIDGRRLLIIADQYTRPVTISRKADGTPVQANVRHELTADGIGIELHAITTDVAAADLEMYELHNTECIPASPEGIQ